jgi:hypothetical protein
LDGIGNIGDRASEGQATWYMDRLCNSASARAGGSWNVIQIE